MYKKTAFPITSGVLLILLSTLLMASDVMGEEKRDGSFWMTLPTDAKQAWLDGYIAASACTVTWAQNSGISDRSIVNLMSMLEIFDIMNKERDIRLIAKHIDMVYSSKKYYGVGLPMALQIAKNRVTRSDNYWQIQREFYALPIEVRDEFLRKYYGGFPNWTNADEFRKKFDEFMRNRKHQQK